MGVVVMVVVVDDVGWLGRVQIVAVADDGKSIRPGTKMDSLSLSPAADKLSARKVPWRPLATA